MNSSWPKPDVEKPKPNRGLTAQQAHDIGAVLSKALLSMVEGAQPPVEEKRGPVPLPPATSLPAGDVTGDAFERLYLRIKNRFIDEARFDPTLLQMIVSRPEIEVQFEPRVVTLDGSTMKGRVARLMAAGWFAAARTVGALRAELKRTGADPGGGTGLYDVVKTYVKDGFMVREGDSYAMAPGVKVTEKELVAR